MSENQIPTYEEVPAQGLSNASKGLLSLAAAAAFATAAFMKFKQAFEDADAAEAEDRPDPQTEGNQ